MPRGYTSAGADARASRRKVPQVADIEEDVEEEEEDEEYEDDGEAGPGPSTAATGGLSEEELVKRAAVLVRTALTMHYAGKLIRRPDMNKLVGGHKLFPVVFARAQLSMRGTLGMELVEMRQKWKQGQGEAQAAGGGEGSGSKGKKRADDAAGDEDAAEGDDTGEAKKVKGSQIYVLRSILPPTIQQAISNPRPLPYEPNRPNKTVVEEDSGSLIKWETADATASGSIALLGIRTVIQCIILTNNRQISDDDLHALLRRFGLFRDTVLPYPPSEAPNPQPLTLDKYLDLLDRSLYLQRVRTTPGTAKEGPGVEWRWGQREPEFSEKAAAKFIQSVVFSGVAVEEEQERELQVAEEREAGGRAREGDGTLTLAKRRKKIIEDVQSAAGSKLTGDL